MTAFKGQHRYTIDNKGRINIPVRFRKVLSPEAQDTFVITRGLEKCLFVYPLDEWKKIEDRLRNLNTNKKDERKFKRLMLSDASDELPMDRQGRIPIPPNLIKYANLDKEAIIIGVLDRIEIWNPEAYAEYMAEAEKDFEEVAENIMLL